MGFVQESCSTSRTTVNFRNALVAVCLGTAACGAAALSLGNARGAVVLGYPVDLSFDVITDPGQSLEGACIAARVLSGDNPVPDARVGVTPQPAVAGRLPSVRVRSSALAVEPVLTVVLEAGCAGKITRTYTFLADLPETVAASARPVAIPLQGGTDAAGAVPQREPAAVMSSGVMPSAAALPLVQPEAVVASPRPRARPASAAGVGPAKARARAAAPVARKPKRPAQPVQAPTAPQSRLVMEPLVDGPQSPASLRLSPELSLPESPAQPEQRAQAQAYWKALSLNPEELLKESARTAALTQEISQLRTQAAQDRDAARQLIERLEAEKSERYSGTLVYLLLGLLVVMAALIAWIATRLRAVSLQAQDAWAAAVAQQAPQPADRTEPLEGGAVVASAPAPLQAPLVHDADVVPAPTPPEPHPVMEPPVLPQQLPAPVPVAASLEPEVPSEVLRPAPPALLINPEELFDLQQQAEFFVSVGEHDQAIEVLKRYIATNEGSAPAAYLELLRLYRSLSRVDDFNQLRAQFHRHFNALLPEFAGFNRPGRSLWAYPEVLAQIEAVWSHESVLLLLDSLLFCQDDTAPERFDMAAYDDLLLLSAIAHTTPHTARGSPPPRERTTPLDAEEPGLPVVDQAPAGALVVPSTGGSVGVTDDNLLDFDSGWLLDSQLKPVEPEAAPKQSEPEMLLPEGSMALDFDLSEPLTSGPVPLPPLLQDGLPPLPASSPPGDDQPIGFGSNSDRFEARFELDPRKSE